VHVVLTINHHPALPNHTFFMLHAQAVFLGCSSFLESNSGYPEKYEDDGELVGLTKVNSSNFVCVSSCIQIYLLLIDVANSSLFIARR
jgi:hypothetical protein